MPGQMPDILISFEDLPPIQGTCSANIREFYSRKSSISRRSFFVGLPAPF